MVNPGEGEMTREALSAALTEAQAEIARLQADHVACKRAVASARRRAAQISLIYEVGQRISGELTLDALTLRVVEAVAETFRFQGVLLFLHDPETGLLKLAARTGTLGASFDPDFQLATGEGAPGRAAETGETQVVGNVAPDDPMRRAAKALRSEIAAPIKSGERFIGVLDVQSDGVDAFDDTYRLAIDSLVVQAAMAIEHARSFEEAHSRADELLVLNELGQALTAQLSVQEVLEEAYRQTSRLVDTSNFFIALYDPDKHELSIEISHSTLEDEGHLDTFSADEGLSGRVLRARQPLLVDDDRRSDRGIGKKALSWLGAPLMVGGEVLGVMVVQSYTIPRLYGERDRDLLVAIANQAAIALQNAHLFEGMQQQVAERTRALRESTAERERLQQEVIEAQRQALRELSTPVIPIIDAPGGGGGVIVMPLIGSIDTARARDITRSLLAGIRQQRAKVVILDVTGVSVIDSGVANHLHKTIHAARLKGACTIVTGVSDAAAETIVDLGIDWSGIETLANLQTGLRAALARMGKRIISS